ncbi:hypothetical protein F8203_gp004 [Heliothis virescens ascovirus 3f]|uniref:Uncharacterized protein n=1 Tax=Heliothis virescens ascovirus 3f TaxID=328614 RepID=A0A171PVA0_9VIRU|nr:hypothetical protein F8203_gp004 [Heliothis virescens ascovirus 3f]AJP08970.1 hypothetical protein [Heliothis virescens ascovirus 3f]
MASGVSTKEDTLVMVDVITPVFAFIPNMKYEEKSSTVVPTVSVDWVAVYMNISGIPQAQKNQPNNYVMVRCKVDVGNSSKPKNVTFYVTIKTETMKTMMMTGVDNAIPDYFRPASCGVNVGTGSNTIAICADITYDYSSKTSKLSHEYAYSLREKALIMRMGFKLRVVKSNLRLNNIIKNSDATWKIKYPELDDAPKDFKEFIVWVPNKLQQVYESSPILVLIVSGCLLLIFLIS